jgi:hypothetical protein
MASDEARETIQGDLERRILHGLSSEWEIALWVLRPSARAGLRKPLFRLGEMNRKLGTWSKEKREICLSREFVLSRSWASVREVLLHETAHQYADEVLGAGEEPPHGPMFQKACVILRANPRASGHYAPLDERVGGTSTNPEDRITDKVRKLLSLAQSKNRHEAETAMAKAHELLRKCPVGRMEGREDQDFVSIFAGKPAVRHFREDYHLGALLQDYYDVFGIWVPVYILEKGKRGTVLEITGTHQKVRIASYAHDFLRRFVDSQWDRYTARKGLNRYRKTDFAVGVIDGFRSRLERQRKEMTGSTRSLDLVAVEDPRLRAHVTYKYPRTSMLRRAALQRDEQVRKDGVALGKALVISQGIAEKGSERKRLIGG